MVDQAHPHKITVSEVYGYLKLILAPESKFYTLAIIYGIGISLLSLALPIAVQMVVNTVANTGLTTPLLVLSLSLFGLLLTAAILNALRIHLMDIFGRRFYARMMSEISLRSIYALNPFFHDYQKGALFNRYFDILIVIRTMPSILVGGFTIVLQAIAGFILVSLYHPMLFAFVLVVVGLLYVIWAVWGHRAILSAVELSHKKHAAAAWVDGLGASNGFFKSERHIAEALDRTEEVTHEYMVKYEKHFRHYFGQTLSLLLLYAAGSAVLLGLGGWLVIQGQLSLGQLVAAELVLSATFFGLSQLGQYIEQFYEMCAAAEELCMFYDVEQAEAADGEKRIINNSELTFVNARGVARNHIATLNFSIPNNALVLGAAETHGVQRELTDFLKRHNKPISGYITLGGQDLLGIRVHEVRQHIIVLDRPNLLEMTIRDYLNLSGEASPERIIEVLSIVDLESTISELDDGLDTRIAATGWPLTITEAMQLKLASSIIADPVVLVLGQLFDTIADDVMRRSFTALQEDRETTIIYFSNRPRALDFDHYLYLGNTNQTMYPTFEKLCEAAVGEPCTSFTELGRQAAEKI